MLLFPQIITQRNLLPHCTLAIPIRKPTVVIFIHLLLGMRLVLIVIMIHHKGLVYSHKVYLSLSITPPIVISTDAETTLKEKRKLLR